MDDKPKIVSKPFKPVVLEEETIPKLVSTRNKPYIENIYLSSVGDGVLYGIEFWGAFELGDNDIGTPLTRPQLVVVNFKPKVR